ncbi:flagellar basal-body rod protein FlgB [Thalassobaculum litoreum DSM 18839]|uniref:Flagellar basal body rod protein FlgB n=2 Tax=Thalassobaculaceae TaxID=2844864 RepID=A0A8G2BN69_9PROT|nr:flagellar basal-body rod protein FlgB [Thalassobaculum litoreum DSM 18839]
MKMSDMSLFRMARQQMDWLGDRQTVLAQNIANADTPNYRAKDLKALSFERELRDIKQVRMQATSGTHLQGTVQKPDFRVEELRARDVYETNPNDNGIVLEEQMMKVSDTQMKYQLASNVYQKNMTMLRTAIGRNGQ